MTASLLYPLRAILAGTNAHTKTREVLVLVAYRGSGHGCRPCSPVDATSSEPQLGFLQKPSFVAVVEHQPAPLIPFVPPHRMGRSNL
jgi:hypothetical protein